MQTEVVVALIAAPPAVLIALSNYHTARSVGRKNGSGSIQDQMSDLRLEMTIDKQHRTAGVRRQAKIEEALNSIKDLVDGIKAHMTIVACDLAAVTEANARHSATDEVAFAKYDTMFAELGSAVADFRTLLGEPAPGDSHVPLIPYFHAWMHKEADRQAKEIVIPKAQMQVIAQAMELLHEYKGKLDENHDQFDRIEANQDIATADRFAVAADLEDATAKVQGVADALTASHERADRVSPDDPHGAAADAGARSDPT